VVADFHPKVHQRAAEGPFHPAPQYVGKVCTISNYKLTPVPDIFGGAQVPFCVSVASGISISRSAKVAYSHPHRGLLGCFFWAMDDIVDDSFKHAGHLLKIIFEIVPAGLFSEQGTF
jgi:hypothetical protein